MRRCTDIQEIATINNKIYIYGSGFRAKILAHFCLKRGMMIEGFLTTTYQRANSLYGIPLECFWDKIEDESIENATLLIAVQEKYWDEITKTLNIAGVRDENIVYIDYKAIAKSSEQIEEMLSCQQVYNGLADSVSKILYCQGTKYRLTNDYSYFLDCFDAMCGKEEMPIYEEYISFAQWLKEKKHKENKKVLLYVPTNFWVEFALPRLKEMGIGIDCIVSDNDNLCKKLKCGVPIISLEAGAKYICDGYLIIGIGLLLFTEDVKNRILNSGFRKECLILPCSNETLFNYGKQYFGLAEMKPLEDEVFVDAGCLNCGTDIDFIEWNKGKYEQIYAFEPDNIMYEKCLSIVENKNLKKIEVVNKGLWSEKRQIGFHHNTNTSLSKICDVGENVIETISLDEFMKGGKVTFLKMDIEGAELEALKGAAETIKRYKPRLAISIYHKVNDYIDIPEYILSLVPEYKLYIRHYSCYKFETILYAIP